MSTKAEYNLRKIKGEKALEILSLAGKPEKTQEEVMNLTRKLIEYGSDAKLDDLDLREITNIVEEINKFNGFGEDFQKAPEKITGK